MDVLQDKLNKFTAHAREILTDKNEFTNKRKKIVVLFQYMTIPHNSEDISIIDLFKTINASEKYHFESGSLITCDSDMFLTVAKLIFEMNSSFQVKQNFVQFILKHLKVLPSEELKFILFDQWSKNRLDCLSSEIMESVISEVHLCLEESILRLAETVCTSSIEHENILINFNRNDIKCIIDLSAKSTIIFQNSLNILNELLILSNVHSNILLTISAFVSAVFERCKVGNLQLFPLEIRDIVIILRRDPNLLDCVTKEIVLKRIYDSMKSNQSASTALITYFPKWLPHILGDASITIEKKHWLLFLQIIQI